MGEGSSQNFDIFTTFFVCSNSFISALKNFFDGSNFDNSQINIHFLLSIFGFSRKKFSFFAHVFNVLKKKRFHNF